MTPKIRPEQPADIAAIHAVTQAAFLNAPHTGHTEQLVVKELRAGKVLTVSLVAEINSEIVGHVAVSPVAISSGSENWFGLGPISVIPELQGKGIGSLLMNAALHMLKDKSAAGCVLLGDPAYYLRFGFKPVAGLVLPGVPTEYFQAISFGSPIPQGIVTYHEAFNAKG